MEDLRTIQSREKYLGQRFKTKDGECEYEIVQYNSYGDVCVEFINDGYRTGHILHTKMGNILKGNVKNPFANSVIAFDTIEHELLGNIYRTNSGDYIRIIGVNTKKNITYQVQDEFGYIGTTTFQNIKNGEIFNPYKRSEVRSYIGEGPYNTPEYEQLKKAWRSLCVRATGSRYKYNNTCVTNTSICDELLCFNKFVDWYLRSTSLLNPVYTYSIDRLILYKYYRGQTNDMFFYCPETLEFIPDDLAVKIQNSIMKNSMNQRNEILFLADKYYSENALTQRAYLAIKNQYNNENNNIIVNIPPYHLKDLYVNALGLQYVNGGNLS